MLSSTTLADTVNPQAGDAVLLIGDAVALAIDQEFINWCSASTVHALSDDLHLRGLTLSEQSNIQPCNYDDMVELTIHHHQIQSC